jgi:hypothetical protein
MRVHLRHTGRGSTLPRRKNALMHRKVVHSPAIRTPDVYDRPFEATIRLTRLTGVMASYSKYDGVIEVAPRRQESAQTVSEGSSGGDKLITVPTTAVEALILSSNARRRTATTDSMSSPERSTSATTEIIRGPTTSSLR